MAMKKLKFTYIDDEQFKQEGTNRRGNKGVWQNKLQRQYEIL